MKTPLWMLNGAFIIIFFAAMVLMFVMRARLPKRISLKPRTTTRRVKVDTHKINPAAIFENDLFGTFVKRVEPIQKEPELIDIPRSPKPTAEKSKKPRAPEFLSPLSVLLKGIVFSSNSAFSRAVISNLKTKEEKLCRIGDIVEDASLIYIGKNKAIFIRSNGQQEILFVTEEDAKEDPAYNANKNWNQTIKRINENTVAIDSNKFKKRITNVSGMFDTLDMTAAFDNGMSIGCRVGQVEPDTMGPKLGLQYSDIITHINDIPATDTPNRVKIYKEIKESGNEQRIFVKILRDGKEIEMSYLLGNSLSEEPVLEKQEPTVPEVSFVKNEIKPVSEAEKTLAVHKQTLGQAPVNSLISNSFIKNDKQAMLKYGGQTNVLQR